MVIYLVDSGYFPQSLLYILSIIPSKNEGFYCLFVLLLWQLKGSMNVQMGKWLNCIFSITLEVI